VVGGGRDDLDVAGGGVLATGAGLGPFGEVAGFEGGLEEDFGGGGEGEEEGDGEAGHGENWLEFSLAQEKGLVTVWGLGCILRPSMWT